MGMLTEEEPHGRIYEAMDVYFPEREAKPHPSAVSASYVQSPAPPAWLLPWAAEILPVGFERGFLRSLTGLSVLPTVDGSGLDTGQGSAGELPGPCLRLTPGPQGPGEVRAGEADEEAEGDQGGRTGRSRAGTPIPEPLRVLRKGTGSVPSVSCRWKTQEFPGVSASV